MGSADEPELIMPFRYFYSTEESDTALKLILDTSKFSKDYTRNENSLTDGVFEYKVEIEQDSEFQLLASKVDDAKIRALASPDRITQFGNIRPDNYFDTTKYAAGCAFRDTDILAGMIEFLALFRAGILIAQRDIDIQGSATLGTVALTLGSAYKKTYNIPVNGGVSDRTLVKVIIDATAPAATQTNATCNQAMFDFANPSQLVTITPSEANDSWVTCALDRKVSAVSTAYSITGTTYSKTVSFNLNGSFSGKLGCVFDVALVATGASMNANAYLDYSSDGGNNYTNFYTKSIGQGVSFSQAYLSASVTVIGCTHVRLRLTKALSGSSASMSMRDMILS